MQHGRRDRGHAVIDSGRWRRDRFPLASRSCYSTDVNNWKNFKTTDFFQEAVWIAGMIFVTPLGNVEYFSRFFDFFVCLLTSHRPNPNPEPADPGLCWRGTMQNSARSLFVRRKTYQTLARDCQLDFVHVFYTLPMIRCFDQVLYSPQHSSGMQLASSDNVGCRRDTV